VCYRCGEIAHVNTYSHNHKTVPAKGKVFALSGGGVSYYNMKQKHSTTTKAITKYEISNSASNSVCGFPHKYG